MTQWIKNTGTMPEGITNYTTICVKYTDGWINTVDGYADQCYWELDGSVFTDIAEYYIVKQ